jgi:dTDP-4-dehydrorhamnose 3,5-epimerase
MKFVETELPGVILITPLVHRDDRGFFLEFHHEKKFHDAGIRVRFVQDNHSQSVKGTLRGLHAQRRHPQGKLIRVIEGEIFDVAVDIRRGSPHFKKWVGVKLSSTDYKMLYVPPGFAHGFCVLSEKAQVEYKCTALYDPQDEMSIMWNDSAVGVKWPVDVPLLSKKDLTAKSLHDLNDDLPHFNQVFS